MVISSFISSILVLALGIWAYMRLESTMNLVAQRQLVLEPDQYSFKMWKDMPVTMYQSFTFFNLTNWNQVKSLGQKPRFVEVGPYVYKTIWSKSEVQFSNENKQINFAERKQWIFMAHLSKGHEEDQIWTINTPLMTALALIQNAPVITRNIVSVILDGLGEGAFIKRNIKSLLFEGYSDLIVSVGPLFDRRFANFNGKFAYLYNKNDSVDGHWSISSGSEDLNELNKILRFQSNIVNMSVGQPPQGLNEVKPECAGAWSLDQATNGQLFAPLNLGAEFARLRNANLPQHQVAQLEKLEKSQKSSQLQQLHQLQQLQASASAPLPVMNRPRPLASQLQSPAKRFFARGFGTPTPGDQAPELGGQLLQLRRSAGEGVAAGGDWAGRMRDLGKFMFYPDLCRPLHLVPAGREVESAQGIRAARFQLDPRLFMNSSQAPGNKCFEMNPRAPLAGTLAAMPALVASGSSPFAMFASAPNAAFSGPPVASGASGEPAAMSSGLFERSGGGSGTSHAPSASSFLNNALASFASTAAAAASVAANAASAAAAGAAAPTEPGPPPGPVGRLGRVRQLLSSMVAQRMGGAAPISGAPSAGSPLLLLPAALGVASSPLARAAPEVSASEPAVALGVPAAAAASTGTTAPTSASGLSPQQAAATPPAPAPAPDRWVTQFRFKWPRGVFSIGQCQLGAPLYASLPHFLDADRFYLEQVDGLRPNRSLHEFYLDLESELHAIPVAAKARLQLNVATPELRFRNIPNAMIPVLWQEISFELERPVARLLYWSLSMSPTICSLLSASLLALGALVFAWSCAVSLASASQARKRVGGPATTTGSRASLASGSAQQSPTASWATGERRALATSLARAASGSTGSGDLQAQGSINYAYSSCTELHDRTSAGSGASSLCCPHSRLARTSTAAIPTQLATDHQSGSNMSGSPKQLSSRASSQCELVASSQAVTSNCLQIQPLTQQPLTCSSGCLLTCIRHQSPVAPDKTTPLQANQIGSQQTVDSGISETSIDFERP